MTGGKGCVGRYLSRLGVSDLACDVTNPLEIQKAIKYAKPDFVIHLASKSNVDWCEKNKEVVSVAIGDNVVEVNVVSAVNLIGVSNVAEIVKKLGIRMILMSTDHIFSGGWWGGRYKESDKPAPKNFYGSSKLAAEALMSAYPEVKIVRSSYMFDRERLQTHMYTIDTDYHNNSYPVFIKRSFMYLPHFANSLFEYIRRFDSMPKILHLAGSDTVSWYEFMCTLARECGYRESNVVPRRKEIEGFAPRGYNLGLSTSLSRKLGFEQWNYSQGIRQMRLDG